MDGQKQKVGENGVALQAGGDISVGMSYTEVKDLVFLLFEQNFPKLAESAAEKALQNIKEYIGNLENRLHEDANKVDFSKFSDPNIQYLLNSTIQNYARKGNSINMDFLMDAFLLVLREKSTSILNIVSEQLISVLPKITKDCVDVLTVLYYVRYYRQNGISSMEVLEPISKKIYDSLSFDKECSNFIVPYLESLGVTASTIFASTPYRDLADQYKDFSSSKSDDEWKKLIQMSFPYLLKIIERYESWHLETTYLNPMGELLALMNVKSILQIDADFEGLFQ